MAILEAASLAVPPLLQSSSVQRLTQHFENMSIRNASSSLEYGSLLDNPTGESAQTQLNHDTISWESYSAQVFSTLELVPSTERHHETEFQLRALGSQFKWTLNQEVVFYAALTGKPKKKLYFSQYCWGRCAIGTKTDYAAALNRPEVAECALSWRPPEFAPRGVQRPIDLYSLQQHRICECGCLYGSLLGLHLADSIPQQRAAARRMEDT